MFLTDPSYSTRFTVAKAEGGEVGLTARSGSLLLYDDYVVDPGQSPTDIPCQVVGTVRTASSRTMFRPESTRLKT